MITSIAPTPATAAAATTVQAPAGWTPPTVTPVPSSRPGGMLKAGFDAWRGNVELGNGQALSPVQVAAIAPFLATTWSLPVDVVTGDLQAVRVYVGGPAAPTPNMAITMGRDIYVQGASELDRIMSFGYRRWLVHELGHVMQWREIPAEKAPTDLARMRATIGHYVGNMLVSDGGGVGALPKGLGWWMRENFDPRNKDKTHISLGNAIHDSHHLEIQAETQAREFERVTMDLGAAPPQPAPAPAPEPAPAPAA